MVVIIHGGFWKQQYNIDGALINSLAPFFSKAGYVACEIEYRRGRLDGGSGGWPITCQDINAALIKLHEYSLTNPVIDINRVAILGHSAGISCNIVVSMSKSVRWSSVPVGMLSHWC